MIFILVLRKQNKNMFKNVMRQVKSYGDLEELKFTNQFVSNDLNISQDMED